MAKEPDASFGPKLPGKTPYSGTRRPTTRRSGFAAGGKTSGGECRIQPTPTFRVRAGDEMTLEFRLPRVDKPGFVGYGAWFLADASTRIRVEGGPAKMTRKPGAAPNWNKVGSLWQAPRSAGEAVTVRFGFAKDGEISLWEPACGSVDHELLRSSRPELLGNMHLYAPEANFYVANGEARLLLNGKPPVASTRERGIALKACNRCSRFLPVNLDDEQIHLAFTNHCSAPGRVPCRHPLFGRITDIDTGEKRQLENGFQLECRFCKKFTVNAPHNRQRSAAQMKEDAARRRGFEVLLAELYGRSAQLEHRHLRGTELVDDVWARFGGSCFKCGARLASKNEMRLDHTRPLALLWPLDATATALCESDNSSKHDRPPGKFYDDEELARLAGLTGIPLDELRSPSPNVEAIRALRARLDWFFQDFLSRPELAEVRDGKRAADLMVKALQKAIDAAPAAERFDLRAEQEKRRGRAARALDDFV